MSRLICAILILLAMPLRGQFSYIIDQDIPVYTTGPDPLPLAWSGGINSAQFNTMDLNNDGQPDLVIFDRTATRILTFLQQNHRYTYAPEYEKFFPDKLSDWVFLRDYNCDGRKDLFTRENLGIVVYKNITEAGGLPAWERATPSVILTQGNNLVNLLPGFNDIPTIADVDGDGDLDILNFRFTGSSTVEFHRNMSMERYGTCEALEFVRETENYGNFEECECGTFAFDGEGCTSSEGRIKHTEGRSLLALDIDHDGDFDFLFSEESCNQLFLLENKGTIENPIFDDVVPYPAANPVDLIYAIPFYEDVDDDGTPDLVISTGLFTKGLNAIDLDSTSWLYHNAGTGAIPDFEFQSKDFLQHQMLDVGDNATPAFFDVDGDGDQDLLISNNFNAGFQSSIHYYKNTGTLSSPSFQLSDADLFGFSNSDYYNLRIQFADMDHDGRADLVFTATRFLNGETWLYYIKNTTASSLTLTGSPIPVMKLPGSGTRVHVGDVNGDGINDLLIGISDGSIQFWKNTGSTGTPSFTLNDDAFLGFGENIDRLNPATCIADLNADGKPDLIVCTRDRIEIISDFRNGHDPAVHTDIIYNPLLNQYTSQNMGGELAITAANLAHTDKPDIIVGTHLGGLNVLRNDEGLALPADPDIRIYPNPVSRKIDDINQGEVKIRTDRETTMRLFSVMGQQVAGPLNMLPNVEYLLSVPSTVAPGLYLARFTFGNRSVTRRLVIR